jgi:hypothetical protein
MTPAGADLAVHRRSPRVREDSGVTAPDGAPMRDGSDGRQGVRLSRTHLAALAVVVATARWGFASNRRVFSIVFDEPVQLAIGRSLSGRTQWNVFDLAFWQPGLGILITPIFVLFDDPTTAFRLVLATNAVIAGLSAAVLASITMTVTRLGPTASSVAAGCVALLPTSILASAHAWAEPLVSLTFLVSLHLLLSFVDSPSQRVGMLAIATAGAGYLAHGRMLPMAFTVTVVVAVVWASRGRYAAALVAAIMAASVNASVFIVSRAITARLWDDPSETNSVGAVLAQLRHPVAVTERAVGQIWYQLVATAGLVGFGIVSLGFGIVQCRSSAIVSPSRRHSIVIGAAFLPMMALSILFMAGHEHRVDFLVYGRYNDGVSWVVVALGAATLLGLAEHSGRSLATWTCGAVVAIAAVGGLVHANHAETLRDGVAVPDMIPGLIAVVGRRTPDAFVPSLVAMILLVSTAVVVRVFTARRAAFAALAVAVTLVGGFRLHRVLDAGSNTNASAAAVREIEQLVPPDVAIGFRFVPFDESRLLPPLAQNVRLQLYQFYLPGRQFERDLGFDDGVGPYVFAPTLNAEYVESDAVLLWRDPDVALGLWLEPSAAPPP